MKLKLSHLNKNIISLIKKIGQEADVKQLKAYAVGGFIRDLILNKENLDLDIVVEGNALQFARALAQKTNAKVATYEQFGTATLILSNHFKFDLVTARKETYFFPGALPVVQNGSIKDDLFRRDFTINALAMAINSNTFGEVIDYYEGLKDLKKRKIRILHPKSFMDDPTRILRAVRFEQRLNFIIEKQTLKRLKEALTKNVVANVKSQRYFEEFRKILEEKTPKKNIERLVSLKALDFLNKDFKLNSGAGILFDRIEKNISWFQKKFGLKKPLEKWLMYFLTLTESLSFDKMQEMLERFNLKKEDREKVILNRMTDKILKTLSNKNLHPYQIYKILQPLSYEIILLCRAKAKSARMTKRIDNFLFKYESVQPYLMGKDLKSLGIEPGRGMGLLLEEILHQKIDGVIQTRLDEIKLVKNLKNKIGG